MKRVRCDSARFSSLMNDLQMCRSDSGSTLVYILSDTIHIPHEVILLALQILGIVALVPAIVRRS